jgi:hypothetical protein
MSKLDAIKQTEQSLLSPDELIAIIEAEERRDGLCPARAWCFVKRLRVSKHAMPWHTCAFEDHRAFHQCHESDNGHERVLDRGDVMAHCVGAAFCKDVTCDHAKVHRWDPLVGCHAVHCRKLEAALAGWNEETKGSPPDMDVVVVCETA